MIVKYIQAANLVRCVWVRFIGPAPQKCIMLIQGRRSSNGFDDQFIYEEIDLHLSHRKLSSEQLLNDEALVAFSGMAINDKTSINVE